MAMVPDVRMHRQNTPDYCGAACMMMVLGSIDPTWLTSRGQGALYSYVNWSNLRPCEQGGTAGWDAWPERVALLLRCLTTSSRFALVRAANAEAMTTELRDAVRRTNAINLAAHTFRAPIVLVKDLAHWVVVAGCWEESDVVRGFHVFDPNHPSHRGDGDFAHVADDDCRGEPDDPGHPQQGTICPFHAVMIEHWTADWMTGVTTEQSLWRGDFLAVVTGADEVPDTQLEMPSRQPPSDCDPITLVVELHYDDATGELLPLPEETTIPAPKPIIPPYPATEPPATVLDEVAAQEIAAGLVAAFPFGANEPWTLVRDGAVPYGRSLLVRAAERQDDWYYIVPFRDADGRVSLLATLDAAPLAGAAPLLREVFARPGADILTEEAIDFGADAGEAGNLVWQTCNESGVSYLPFIVSGLDAGQRYSRLDRVLFAQLTFRHA